MKLAAYAAQTEEHLSLEDTNLLIAGAVHFVIQLAWDTRGRRCISSVREVADADGRQVISNEVYAPGPDRRAIPTVPVRADTMDELVAAGYQPAGVHPMTGGSPALAGILGAGTGLGLILIVCGLRGTAPLPASRRWQALLAAARRQATAPRVAGTVLAAAVAVAATDPLARRHHAGRAGGLVPAAHPGTRPRSRPGAVERIEAIASWTEQLRDTLAAAAGLEQAILATAPIAPDRSASRSPPWPPASTRASGCPTALRAFAAEAADPAADLVAAALLLAAEQQARDLGQLLSSLADSARQHAAMRHADRRQPRPGPHRCADHHRRHRGADRRAARLEPRLPQPLRLGGRATRAGGRRRLLRRGVLVAAQDRRASAIRRGS